MMDCDTTGIEPDLALIKYKKLVGGGMIKIVNNTVPTALFKLGYTHEEADEIVSYIDATGTIEGAPHIKDEHLAVFDCSFKPQRARAPSVHGTPQDDGRRSALHLRSHLEDRQPARDATTSKISSEAYIQAWKLGLKAVAIYRDGCKKSQPLSAAGTKTALLDERRRCPQRCRCRAQPEENLNGPPRAVRHKLKEERTLHHAQVQRRRPRRLHHRRPLSRRQPGEIFITMAKEGSTVSGLMDSFSLRRLHRLATRRSAETALRKIRPHALRAQRMDQQSRHRLRQVDHGLHLPLAAPALLDRTAADAIRKPAPEARAFPPPPKAVGDLTPSDPSSRKPRAEAGISPRRRRPAGIIDLGDAPTCSFCGSIMTRNGSCYRCMSCGSTSGCS